MLNKKFTIPAFFIILFSLYFTGSALAGRMVIKPILTTGMGYESNYYSSSDNERSVTSYYLKPGIQFGYTTAKSNLMFDYTLNAYWYDENGTPPAGEISISEHDYVGHDLEFSADTQITDRLNIAFSDTFILTRNPDFLDPYSNEIIRQKYSINKLYPRFTYQFGDKFSVGAGYTYTDIDYNNDTDEDSKENRGSFNLKYQMNSLNSLDLQFQIWEKEYSRTSPDYTSHQTMLMFFRELKYYTISMGAGWQGRSFDSTGQSDMSNVVWTASIFGDRPQFNLSINQNYNDTALANDYYVATRFSASVGRLFLEKLNVKVGGYYQNSDYESINREDDTWSVNARVDYLRNHIFSIGAETGLETRDSSLSSMDYENSYISLEININLNLGAK